MQGFLLRFRTVATALIPLVLLVLFSSISSKGLSAKKLINILAGFLFILIGMSLFLQGVNAGFLPMGKAIGEAFSIWPHKWILIPFGFVLGFAGTMVEPAVRVLNYQVEKLTAGHIPQKIMLFTISTGGGLAVSLAMLRILFGVPLEYLVLPGYFLVLILMIFSERSFVAIAFDSGAVASGPMMVTFVTAFTIGLASGLENRSGLIDGLGLVSLVALMPVITVLVLGLLYSYQERKIRERVSKE